MRILPRFGPSIRPTRRRAGTHCAMVMAWLAIALTAFWGCARRAPQATIEGTVRLRGTPMDNCLVTFLPKREQGVKLPHSTGLTDRQGVFRLRFDNQEEGAAVGWHRVIIQDLSVSIGVRRRDHGTVDAGMEESMSPSPVRRSRVPDKYTSAATTPLSKVVNPGHQVIDLDIQP